MDLKDIVTQLPTVGSYCKFSSIAQSNNGEIPNIPNQGIYVLVAKYDHEHCIELPFGKDFSNILYVGKAANGFNSRMSIEHCNRDSDFKNMTKQGPYYFNHSCLYYVLDIDQKFKLSFYFRGKNIANGFLNKATPELYYFTFSKKDAHLAESALLSAYVLDYGTLPVFNATGSSIKSANYCQISINDFNSYRSKILQFKAEIEKYLAI